MIPRQLLSLAFIALLCISASALTVTSLKPSYLKGEAIFVAGQCDPDSMVEVKGVSGVSTLFEDKAACTGSGELVFSYQTSCLDPAGKLFVEAKSGKSVSNLEFDIMQSPACSYYLLAFLSPARGIRHLRTETMKISVSLTEAGNPVDGAQAAFYSPTGEIVPLVGEGKGIYSIDYFIPSNARVGDIALTAVATKNVSGGVWGGESVVEFPLAKAPIIVEVMEPKINNFDLEQAIPLQLELTYSSGIKVENAVVEAEINGSKAILDRSHSTPNIFSSSYVTQEKDLGALTINFKAVDAFGNQGESQANVVVSAEPLALFIRNTLGVIIAAAFIIGLVGFLAFRKGTGFMGQKALEEEAKSIEEELERLHYEYYDSMNISKEAYTRKTNELLARQKEVKRRLAGQQKTGF